MEKENVARQHVRMDQTADLLEILKCRLHCTYISDLRMEPYNSGARALLEGMDLEAYHPRHIVDVLKYVYAAA